MTIDPTLLAKTSLPYNNTSSLQKLLYRIQTIIIKTSITSHYDLPALRRPDPCECQGCQSELNSLDFKLRRHISQLINAQQGIHLITQSTPNGQKVQIFLEELAAVYGTEWTTTLMLVKSPVSRANSTNDVVASDISTNEQKKDWFLRLNPNGNGHSFY